MQFVYPQFAVSNGEYGKELENAVPMQALYSPQQIIPNPQGYIRVNNPNEFGKETQPPKKKRSLIRKVVFGFCGVCCALVLISILVVGFYGFKVKNCLNPKFTSEASFSFEMKSNITQFLQFDLVAGGVKFRTSDDPNERNVTVKIEMGAHEEESLGQMGIFFNQTESGVHIQELARNFEMFENCQTARLEITFPQNADLSHLKISIVMQSGMVNLDEEISLSSLNLTMKTGFVKIEEAKIDRLTTSINTGAIDIKKLTSVNVTADIKAGALMVENSFILNLNLTVVRGEISIENIHQVVAPINTSQSISAIISQGKIDIKDSNYGSIYVSADKGNVKIEVNHFIFGGNYYLFGQSKMEGNGYVPLADMDNIRSGTIGNYSNRTQTLTATVKDGKIKLKVD